MIVFTRNHPHPTTVKIDVNQYTGTIIGYSSHNEMLVRLDEIWSATGSVYTAVSKTRHKALWEISESKMKISIQSWCFRTWSEPEKVIQATKTCGLDYIELGSMLVDPFRDSDYMSIINRYRSAGIEVSGHGVNGLDTDQATNRTWFEFARAIGLKSLASSFPKGEEIETALCLEPLCEKFGIKIAIHNHGRKHNLGSPDALDRVFSRTSENIGLCLDTAWMLDSGYDPVEMADKYRDRLHGVHLKDFIFERDGRPEDTVIGEGNLRLDALIQLLNDTGYDQFLTIEYEGDVENPVPNCKKCVEVIKTALG